MRLKQRLIALTMLFLLLFCNAIPAFAGEPNAEQLANQLGLKEGAIKLYSIDIPKELTAGHYVEGNMRLRNESNQAITAQIRIRAELKSSSGGTATLSFYSKPDIVTIDANSTYKADLYMDESAWGYGVYNDSKKEYVRDYREFVNKANQWNIEVIKKLDITEMEYDTLFNAGYRVRYDDENGAEYVYAGGVAYPLKITGVTDDFKGLEGWIYKDQIDQWFYYKKGVKQIGWVLWKGEWYYLSPMDGSMTTNAWAQDSVGYCWMDKDGKITRNKWIKDHGEWSYLKANGYMARNEWAKDSKDWYWMGDNGTISKDTWARDSKGWCWMGADGKITKNSWIQWNGDWFFLKADGYMATNMWMKDSKGWCWLNADGRMAKEKWVSYNGKWYYISSTGRMAVDWQNIDGKMYLFKNSGVMAANEWVKGRWLDADGVWRYPQQAEWKKDAKGWWYGDSSGWYAKNASYMIDDVRYTFDANGYIK